MTATPGPWAIDQDSYHIVSTAQFAERFDDDEEPAPARVICFYGAMGGDDSRADLRLLAAAPELRDTLEEALVAIRLISRHDGALLQRIESVLASLEQE